MSVFDFISKPVLNWLKEKSPVSEVPLCDFERICESIETCDVLLIEGRSRVSEVIKTITQSSWSHSALYIGRIDEVKNSRLKALLKQHYIGSESDQLIAESELGLGTVIRPIHVYQYEHIRICRPKDLSSEDKQAMIRYVVSCLGYEYNVRQILDLARFLFPWHFLPRSFRSTLFKHNIGDATKTVCSTMLCEAFNFVQFPILPLVESDENKQLKLYRRNPKLCVPRDFDYSPYFEIIKYPFLNHQHAYKDLPWHSKVESSLQEHLDAVKRDEQELNERFQQHRIAERGERRLRQVAVTKERRASDKSAQAKSKKKEPPAPLH